MDPNLRFVLVNVTVPLFLVMYVLAVLTTRDSACDAFCPPTCSGMSSAARRRQMVFPATYLAESWATWRGACKSLCPHTRKRCRDGVRVSPSKSSSKSMAEIDLRNLVATLPDEKKTVFFSRGRTAIEDILLDNGWMVVSDIAAAHLVYFVRRKHAKRRFRREPTAFDAPLVNFVRHSHVMTEKYSLVRVLRNYAATAAAAAAKRREKRALSSGSSIDGNDDDDAMHALSLQPRSFLLNDRAECTRFFANAAHYEDGRVWLVKASALSRGEGIRIFANLSDAARIFVDPDSDSGECRANETSDLPDDRHHHLIAQEYILNPLLLAGKKMEIRSYWLLASLDPLIALYHDGTVRRTTSDYTRGNWDDPLVHITNTFQQKKANAAGYAATQDDRKWTISQMERYLVGQKKGGGVVVRPGWWRREMKPQLKRILATVLRASKAEMMTKDSARAGAGAGAGAGGGAGAGAGAGGGGGAGAATASPPFGFSLMGFDVILDDDLRPWLTEVQTGPGLSMDDAVKKALIKPMATEALNIALEVYHRKQICMSLATLESVRNFEVVINEAAEESAATPATPATPAAPATASASASASSVKNEAVAAVEDEDLI